MARFKQIRNSSQLYTQNANGSGKSFLNEKTRLNLQDSQQNRQAYISIGTNTDHLLINTAYNDNNTINFNVDDNYNGPLEQQLWATNISTGLSEELLGRDSPEWNVKNQRITINDQLATPSTLPDMTWIYPKNNLKSLVNKFTKKVNPVEIKFHPFTDVEYIENNLTNQDFIKGNGEYSFLNTDLYEETSIDIELDTPVDTLLQNTAYFQTASSFDDAVNNENKNIKDYEFTPWANSPYEFRQSVDQTYSRLNTPTVIYNFKEGCWEYRGIPCPHQFFLQNPFNLDTQPVIANDPDLSLLTSVPTYNAEDNAYKKFASYFDRYILSELPLTNNPINYLRGDVELHPNINHSNLSLPTTQFGFPHFNKFHAFDENLIDISKYINKPFIIDRISLNLNVELQSEFYVNPILNDIEVRNGINASLNFFLINQTPAFSKGLQQKAFANFFIKNSTNLYSVRPFKNLLGFNSSKLRDLEFFTNTSSYRQLITNSLLHTKRNVTRINAKNLTQGQYNNLINYNFLKTKLYLNDDQNNTLDNPDLLINLASFHEKYENFSKAFKREVITFGNIDFYSKGQLDLSNSDIEDRIKNIKNKIINNSDSFIETDDYYTTPQLNNNLEIHILDYAGNVNLTTYVKKPSNLIKLNIANQNNLSSHHLNYQVDLNDSLDEYFISANSKKSLVGETIAQFYQVKSETRNFLNNQSGRDIENALISELNNLNQTTLMTTTNLNIQSNQNIPKIADTAIKNSGNIQLVKKSNASPYLLLPNDKIAFYLSISPTLSPKIYKQLLKIKQGKVKFTLHGYIPKNNKSLRDWNNLKNLNQNNLTTSIIGNNEFITDSYNNNYYQYSNIYNIYDRVYTGIFSKKSDLSAAVSTINDQTNSTISGSEKTIDITNLVYNNITQTLINELIINFECTNLNNSVTRCILLINLNNKIVTNEKEEILIQIKNKTGLDFRLKFINKNNTTFWPLYDTTSLPSHLKNATPDEVSVNSINENYTFFWNSNTSRFDRLTTRKIENRELFFFGQSSLLGSKILFGEFYNPFIDLKIDAYKNDMKYVKDYKHLYDDSFSFKKILEQIYQKWINIKLYIEGLQDELSDTEKENLLNLNVNKFNKLIQEVTFFKNSTHTQSVAAKNKRNYSKYFELRSYGQFKDRVNQNISMMMINNENLIEGTVEQKFVNGQTGVELYNFANPVLNNLKNVTTRNKSRYCSLLDAGYNLNNDEVQAWSVNDYWHYKHVAFKDDAISPDTYLTTIITSPSITPENVRQIIF